MRRFILLALLCCSLIAFVATEAGAWRTTGQRWQRTTISYYVSDRSLVWPVQWAAHAWSSSGANVRFVPAKSRNTAHVVVVRKQPRARSTEAGLADVTSYGNAISRAYVGLRGGLDPYQLALVATHEFGHALGLDHEDRSCAIMNSWITGYRPEKCSQPPAGYWWCRLLAADDIAGAIAIYGGRARAPKQPEYCPRHS